MRHLVWCPDRGGTEETAVQIDDAETMSQAAEDFAAFHSNYNVAPFDEIEVVVLSVPEEGKVRRQSFTVEPELTFTAFRVPK